MLRAVLLVFALLPAAARAFDCAGADLIAALPEAERAAITAAAEAAPYPRGNLWRATRGDREVTLLGTYHLDDPRHDAILDTVGATLGGASVLLVEAGPEEEAALKSELARDPAFLLAPQDAPTLRETLTAEEWDVFGQALRNRGIPPFMAARFRPWYIAVLLSVPSCAMPAAAEGNGLDKRLMDMAVAGDVPIRALEPWDTAFRIFEAMPQAAQVDMIRTSLALEAQAEDQMATLATAYFAEDSRVIWEYMRLLSLGLPGATPEKVATEFAQMEEALMSARNRAWIPVIETATAEGPAFAAFGALHLSGREGVLALLERDGWTLERLPFPR